MTPSGHGTAIIGAGLMGRWHADAVKHIGGAVTVIVHDGVVVQIDRTEKVRFGRSASCG